jgi:hypothetical protein
VEDLIRPDPPCGHCVFRDKGKIISQRFFSLKQQEKANIDKKKFHRD